MGASEGVEINFGSTALVIPDIAAHAGKCSLQVGYPRHRWGQAAPSAWEPGGGESNEPGLLAGVAALSSGWFAASVALPGVGMAIEPGHWPWSIF